MRYALKVFALGLGLLAPGAALAASSAVVTTDLNVRTGPGPGYQRYGTIPAGDEVTVYGCLSGYNWCDIDWRGGRGWVSGNYLLTLGREYYRRPLSSVGVYVGVPVLGFDPYDYHRRYYTGRSWYRDRYLDGPPRHREFREHRRDDRFDRRGDRFDHRNDRYDRDRFDRRDDRRGDRFDRRDERGEGGDERFDRSNDRALRDNDRFDPRPSQAGAFSGARELSESGPRRLPRDDQRDF